MNENLNLVEILKDCPKGTKLYSTIHGEVEFNGISNNKDIYKIRYKTKTSGVYGITPDGKFFSCFDGECILFPSKYQRDWSKFKPKKPKFDPKTLKHFDRIIARIDEQGLWCCELFSFIEEGTSLIKGCGAYYKYCVPYNNDTKHLVGTKEDAPEYYRYWED